MTDRATGKRPGRPPGYPKTGGRQKGYVHPERESVRHLARQYGPAVIKRLAEMAGVVDGFPPAQSEVSQVAAMRELLDRGFGRAVQPLSSADGEPLIVQILKFGTEPDEPAGLIDVTPPRGAP